MPHIIVEYSDNLGPDLEIPALLHDLHNKLGDHPDVSKAAIKSRAICIENAVVGEDEDANEMIHIMLKLLPRPESVREKMAEELQEIALAHTQKHSPNCTVTVETVELDAHTYCK